MNVLLNVAGERRGVPAAVSANEDPLSENDLRFLDAAPHSIGLVERPGRATRRLRTGWSSRPAR
jgi:hypothetical protein